jgi:cAMP-dependent protein kinase regulator
MFEVKKKVGEIIMNQGDKGDNFYVIDSGEVDVIISPGKGKPGVSQAHLKDGQGFGELALMYNSPRSATIKAITDVTLWAIDRSTYRHVMMDTVMAKRHKYQEFIKKVPFLSSLQGYEINLLCDAFIPLEYPANSTVIIEGEPGSRFYIIEEGEVVIIRNIKGKGPIEVNRLKTSQYFGEIALMTPTAKRMATVKTLTPAKFLAVDGNAFSRLLGPLEPILKRNMDNYNLFMKK